MKNITVGIIKFIGFFAIWWAIPFRAYARNYIQNGVLQWKYEDRLSRLWQREPELHYLDFDEKTPLGWELKDIVHNIGENGFIKYRKVNKYQFWFILWTVYIWLDDDSNHDTTDLDYIKTWVNGERKDYKLAGIVRWLVRKVNFNQVYGNSFDLGDIRAEHPYFNFWCTFFWNLRNLSMNYQYMFRGY